MSFAAIVQPQLPHFFQRMPITPNIQKNIPTGNKIHGQYIVLSPKNPTKIKSRPKNRKITLNELSI